MNVLKTNIFTAHRICKDIESLHKNGVKERIYSHYDAYFFNEYSIDVLGDESKITATRHKKSISDEKIPFNLWTGLIGIDGNYKTLPVRFDVEINNNGFFTSIPMGDKFIFKGLAARIVYKKMCKEYNLAQKHQWIQR